MEKKLGRNYAKMLFAVFMEAAPYKTADGQPITSHLTNYVC